jgi:hypothetical protein
LVIDGTRILVTWDETPSSGARSRVYLRLTERHSSSASRRTVPIVSIGWSVILTALYRSSSPRLSRL